MMDGKCFFKCLIITVLQFSLILTKTNEFDFDDDDVFIPNTRVTTENDQTSISCNLKTDPLCNLTWSYDQASNSIKFELNGIQAKEGSWYAIGFNTRRMMADSIVLVFQFIRRNNLEAFIGLLEGYAPPIRITHNSLEKINRIATNGLTSLSFQVPSKIPIKSSSLDFRSCLVVAIASGGLIEDDLMAIHQNLPFYSLKCFHFAFLQTITTVQPPQITSIDTKPPTKSLLKTTSFSQNSIKCNFLDPHCKFSWTYIESLNVVRFHFTMKRPLNDAWYAIGFNNERQMLKTSVFMIEHIDGNYKVYTGFIESRKAPQKDSKRHVNNHKTNLIENSVEVIFDVQPIIKHNNDMVLDLTNCYNVVIGAGSIESGVFLKHSSHPQFTSSCHKLITVRGVSERNTGLGLRMILVNRDVYESYRAAAAAAGTQVYAESTSINGDTIGMIIGLIISIIILTVLFTCFAYCFPWWDCYNSLCSICTSFKCFDMVYFFNKFPFMEEFAFSRHMKSRKKATTIFEQDILTTNDGKIIEIRNLGPIDTSRRPSDVFVL